MLKSLGDTYSKATLGNRFFLVFILLKTLNGNQQFINKRFEVVLIFDFQFKKHVIIGFIGYSGFC